MVLQHLAERGRRRSGRAWPRAQIRRDRLMTVVYSGSMPFEEERQVRREVVDLHAAGEVVLDDGCPLDRVKASCEIGFAPGLGDNGSR